MKKVDYFLGFFLLMLVSFFLDRVIFNSMRGLVNVNLLAVMFYLSHFVFLVIFVLVCSYLLWNKKEVVYLWGGIGLSYVVSLVLKYLIARPRPFWVSQDFGFPSSHAAIYFFMFMFMSERFGKYKNYFLGIALLVSFSRLYLGVHYLSDLIGGGLVGAGLYLGYKKWLKI